MHDKELYAVKTRWQSHIVKLKLTFPILDFSLNPIFAPFLILQKLQVIFPQMIYASIKIVW